MLASLQISSDDNARLRVRAASLSQSRNVMTHDTRNVTREIIWIYT